MPNELPCPWRSEYPDGKDRCEAGNCGGWPCPGDCTTRRRFAELEEALKDISSVNRTEFEAAPTFWGEKMVVRADEALKLAGR